MPAHKGYIRATPHGPDRPDDWREQAECKDDPIPDLWFVPPGDRHGIAAAKAARDPRLMAGCLRALASSPFTEFTACLYAAASASSAVGSFRPDVASVSRSRSHGGEVLARSASAPEP